MLAKTYNNKWIERRCWVALTTPIVAMNTRFRRGDWQPVSLKERVSGMSIEERRERRTQGRVAEKKRNEARLARAKSHLAEDNLYFQIASDFVQINQSVIEDERYVISREVSESIFEIAVGLDVFEFQNIKSRLERTEENGCEGRSDIPDVLYFFELVQVARNSGPERLQAEIAKSRADLCEVAFHIFDAQFELTRRYNSRENEFFDSLKPKQQISPKSIEPATEEEQLQIYLGFIDGFNGPIPTASKHPPINKDFFSKHEAHRFSSDKTYIADWNGEDSVVYSGLTDEETESRKNEAIRGLVDRGLVTDEGYGRTIKALAENWEEVGMVIGTCPKAGAKSEVFLKSGDVYARIEYEPGSWYGEFFLMNVESFNYFRQAGGLSVDEAVTENNSDTAPNEKKFSIKSLIDFLGISRETLSKYGKPAVGHWAARGKRNFSLTLPEATKAVLAVKKEMGQVVSRKCDEWLLENPTNNPI